MKEILEWVKTIIISIVIALIITTFIMPLQVDGISMNPTLNDHDYLILEKTNKIDRGDIISFKSDLQFSAEELKNFNLIKRIKLGKTKNLIKRVIAVEGDQLLIGNGKVYVNGESLTENYIDGNCTLGNVFIKEIPKNKIFVMGDNRNNSMDSRMIGLVDRARIQGKVFVRILPISKFGKVYE
ncbi:signal peptidase I [Marinisporobacter balticus]|nr:signal peptidase I [Marinisporobacter balticus]